MARTLLGPAILLATFDVILSANILLMPLPTYSHVNPMMALGQILLEDGHDVFVFLPHLYNHMANLKATSKVKVIEYPIKAWEWNAAMHAGKVDTDTDYFDYITQSSYVADLKAKGVGYHLVCKAVMMSKIIDRNIKMGLKFDLGIVDSNPLARCHYALMYKYNISYVSYMQEYDPWLIKSPAVPSYVPVILAESLTDKMSLWQRVVNIWTLLYWNIFMSLPTFTDDYIETYVPDKEFCDIDELITQSKLWLSDTNFLLDYPRPVSSNELTISLSLMHEEQGTLPKVITDAANASSSGSVDGIIVVSLDQNIPLPLRVVSTMLKTFKTYTTYVFIWQSSMDVPEESIPPNVKYMPYVSVNSLLSHSKTKLLITSADNLDQNMALYHGVPSLCIPFDGHQRYNAKRIESRRYGAVIPPQELNPKALHSTIKRLLFSKNDTESIADASRIMKIKQPTAERTLLEWINIALTSDISNLRPYALEMPWHRYLLVDVAILFTLLMGNFVFLFWSVAVVGVQKIRNLKQAKQMQNNISVKVQQVINQSKATISPTTPTTAAPVKNLKQQ